MYEKTTHNSLGQFYRKRSYYTHISKPLETKHVVLAPEVKNELGVVVIPEIAVDVPVVTKQPGTTRYTSREAWERHGKRGTLDARGH